MKADQFLEVLRSARYRPGWKISGSADLAMGIVFIDADVARARNGGRFRQQWASRWVCLARLTTEGVYRLVRDTIAQAEQHERDERLRFGRLRPFNPHGD